MKRIKKIYLIKECSMCNKITKDELSGDEKRLSRLLWLCSKRCGEFWKIWCDSNVDWDLAIKILQKMLRKKPRLKIEEYDLALKELNI